MCGIYNYTITLWKHNGHIPLSLESYYTGLLIVAVFIFKVNVLFYSAEKNTFLFQVLFHSILDKSLPESESSISLITT